MMLFARNQCTSTSRISRSSRIRLFPIQRRSFSKFRSFPTAPVTIEMCVSNCNGKQRETNVRTLCKGDFIRETIFRRSLQIINCGRFELGPTEKMTSKTVVHDDYCTTPSLSLCGYLSICVCVFVYAWVYFFLTIRCECGMTLMFSKSNVRQSCTNRKIETRVCWDD